MNSYDVVSGVGTNIYEVNVAELINLIDKAPKTKEAIIVADWCKYIDTGCFECVVEHH